jgi:hypothetical protein
LAGGYYENCSLERVRAGHDAISGYLECGSGAGQFGDALFNDPGILEFSNQHPDG